MLRSFIKETVFGLGAVTPSCHASTVLPLPDGRVLLEAQGSVTDVRRLILRLKASPPIRVTGFRVLALPPVPGETRFSVCARG